ncbi:MAG: hypothetical protein HYV53_04545 [Parcubacteria group bacterium]|nr:hypothetical protein [Parcubacteria group bacterium]
MKVKIVSKEQRRADHLRCVEKKIGLYVRKQAKKGNCDYQTEIEILAGQARILRSKLAM